MFSSRICGEGSFYVIEHLEVLGLMHVLTTVPSRIWEVGRRFMREGKYVHLWLIHVDV